MTKAERSKLMWQDPAFREKMRQVRAECNRRNWQNPEYRANQSRVRSKNQQARWKSFEYREKQHVARSGENNPAFKHGMRDTPEFNSFANAKQRCTNPKSPKFADYGGRGIEFRFTSFEEFLAEVGRKPSAHHSLDRFPNVNGHYEKGNVRWATRSEQSRNRRPTEEWLYQRSFAELQAVKVELIKILGEEGNGKTSLEMIEMLREKAFCQEPEYGIEAC